jgi:hypothetical protein
MPGWHGGACRPAEASRHLRSEPIRTAKGPSEFTDSVNFLIVGEPDRDPKILRCNATGSPAPRLMEQPSQAPFTQPQNDVMLC